MMTTWVVLPGRAMFLNRAAKSGCVDFCGCGHACLYYAGSCCQCYNLDMGQLTSIDDVVLCTICKARKRQEHQ